ncbi:forkhead box protein N4 [Erpetoichthys calabaricus]|uniref:forkhead box protein N4 n=1 Tax=Erpetoichthys calabaricus TaxID=27687 RepID=UPI00109FDE65|nr:forkhead box protein N4 [Erpetoichthys calabaricus]XP_051776928.1 forkhead box protein N4 [Erpetoichthys calabaricus]XP_051776929.1 forkhead box protein N4 [Erpetoichthys calabaricus]
MIESGLTSRMSGILGNPGQSHHPSTQDYRLMTSDPSQLSEDDIPSDLQSLSWLTSVDVPRLQQMATGRLDFSMNSQNSQLEQQTAQVGSMSIAGTRGTMIHIQGSMQTGLLGMSSFPAQGANMTQYAMSGQPSPGYQAQQTLYQPASQQVYAISQASQQCSSAAVYSNTFASQTSFSQPRLAPHGNQDLQPKSYPKPIYSYSCLIAMALKNSKTGSLPVSEIYSFMKEHFPYFKTAPDGWKNSVRHNLSLNKCFEKVENKMSSSSRKGCLWALNPAKIDKMEEEMQKWKRKDLPSIRRSMANPDELDKLITDRPETCRRKTCEPGPTPLPTSQMGLTLAVRPQAQSVMSLSLQSLPLHHQLQTQVRLAPGSPAPAQTPPQHSVPDLSHSPLEQQQQHAKHGHDFFSMNTDMSTEVDTLDPSIMDFALQGNLWEEMKDESFNLDTLGAFSNSPLRLSDYDLGMAGVTPVSGSSELSFPDLQVTGMYTTYTTLDTVSPQYMNTQGNKPIALL